MPTDKSHAASILPLIQQLTQSDGFKLYLEPKLNDTIESLKNQVLYTDCSPEAREYRRIQLITLKEFKESISHDYEFNKRVLADD